MVGESLLVEANIEGRWCKCVVDTGSNITIVRPDMIELSSVMIQPTKTEIRTVAGGTVPVRGHGKLKITIGDSEKEHDVWVADIVEEGLIGLDYLVANGCQVDLAGKLLYVGNDEVPLISQPQPETSSMFRIVVRRTVAITAMSEAVIPGRLDSCDKQNRWAVTEPMKSSNGKLLVARALVDLTAENLPIRVMNLTNGYVSLKKGTEIAVCEPVECVRKLERQSLKEDDQGSVPNNNELPEHLNDLYCRSKSAVGSENERQLADFLN